VFPCLSSAVLWSDRCFAIPKDINKPYTCSWIRDIIQSCFGGGDIVPISNPLGCTRQKLKTSKLCIDDMINKRLLYESLIMTSMHDGGNIPDIAMISNTTVFYKTEDMPINTCTHECFPYPKIPKWCPVGSFFCWSGTWCFVDEDDVWFTAACIEAIKEVS